MKITSGLWFWLFVLGGFLALILWGDELAEESRTKYVKEKMRLVDVHFSEMDKGFESVRFFADTVDMDDSQQNMLASNVRALFYDKLVATRSGELLASAAQRSPYEIRFWGDVRVHNTDRERMRTEEMRYFQARKELYTTSPVTIWKDDMIITGRELRYHTGLHEGELRKDVLIRIWPSASGTARQVASGSATGPATLKSLDLPSMPFLSPGSGGLFSPSGLLHKLPGIVSFTIVPDGPKIASSPQSRIGVSSK